MRQFSSLRHWKRLKIISIFTRMWKNFQDFYVANISISSCYIFWNSFVTDKKNTTSRKYNIRHKKMCKWENYFENLKKKECFTYYTRNSLANFLSAQNILGPLEAIKLDCTNLSLFYGLLTYYCNFLALYSFLIISNLFIKYLPVLWKQSTAHRCSKH